MATTLKRKRTESESSESNADERPSSRRRTPTPDNDPELLIRHGRIYFEDGNIVIAAEQTRFRVHKSVLSMHSEVFRDMFTIPQVPAIDAPMFDGCYVVEVTDKAEDMEMFLRRIYGAGERYRSWYNDRVAVTFAEARALLNLSMKYNVPHLADEATHRFRRCFPSTLIDWAADLHTSDEHPPLSDISARDSIAVINLTRRFDIDGITPLAFYALCQLPRETVLESVVYSDGDGDGDVERLDIDDVRLCLQMSDDLMHARRRFCQILCSLHPSDECEVRARCGDVLRDVPTQLMACGALDGLDVMRDYIAVVDGLWDGVPCPLCSHCVTELRDRLWYFREKVWERLSYGLSRRLRQLQRSPAP